MRNGEEKNLKRASGVRYAKVFSLWTPAPIILEITKALRAPKTTK